MLMENKIYEYLIIGGGPAGLQLGYCFNKSKRDYLVLEAGSHAGKFFETYPRHRKLISINKVHTGSEEPEFNMRHDWNSLLTDDYSHLFKDYDKDFFPSADKLVEYLRDFAEKYQINLRCDTKVVSISRNLENENFIVRDEAGNEFCSKYLIVATGVSRDYVPDIPGIELAETYSDMSLDTTEFENKRVLIIGKANSAFETADHLASSASLIHLCSPNSIVMAWKSHYVGNLRAINNNILDTYQLKSQNAVLDAQIVNIRKTPNGSGQFVATFKYAHAECEVEDIVYDRILSCAGFRIDDSIYDESCRPELTIRNKYPRLTAEFESVNQKGLYFSGTLTHSLDYRKTTSGFIHGFRYNARALVNILNYKNHGVQWERKKTSGSPEILTELSLERVNHSSGLWQQPGFIADVITREMGSWYHRKELPIEYAKEFCAEQELEYFTVTLEYGEPIMGDPFNVERIHRENIDQANRSQFLHPVVRYWDGMELLAEHHVLEDLEAIWEEEEHFVPLQSFFRNCLYGAVLAQQNDSMQPAAANLVMEL